MIYVGGEPRLGGWAFSSRRTMSRLTGPMGRRSRSTSTSMYAAHEKAMSLGARLLKPADAIESTGAFQVYADPAGHPFCLEFDP